MGNENTKGHDASTGDTPATRSRLTPIDVQQKEFRVSRLGGYKMRDVDEFLDQHHRHVHGPHQRERSSPRGRSNVHGGLARPRRRGAPSR